MTYDVLSRALSRLDGFNADRWSDLLEDAQQQTEQAIADFDQNQAARYTSEGQQQERERLRQPEQLARERALQEAEAGLRYVAEAQALLDTHTGLTASEVAAAHERDFEVQLRSRTLAPADLARQIRANVTQANKSMIWLWMQYATQRLQSLQADLEDAGDNPVARSRARGAIEALRPALQEAQAALESPKVAELKAKITEVERSAGRLKGKARAAPMVEVMAAKRREMGYEL
jgi:hypothetical protein